MKQLTLSKKVWILMSTLVLSSILSFFILNSYVKVEEDAASVRALVNELQLELNDFEHNLTQAKINEPTASKLVAHKESIEAKIRILSEGGQIEEGFYYSPSDFKKVAATAGQLKKRWDELRDPLQVLATQTPITTKQVPRKVLLAGQDSGEYVEVIQQKEIENKAYSKAIFTVSGVFSNVQDINSEIKDLAKKSHLKAEQDYHYALFYVLLAEVALVIAVLLILRNSFIRPITKIANDSKAIADGNLETTIEYNKSNELGEISLAIDQLVDQLQSATEFVRNIGEGKLDAKLEVAEGHNSGNEKGLAKELINMQEKMQKVAREDKERSWSTEGLAKFVEILRSNNEDLETLSDRIISDLVNYVQANQGGIFILEKDDEDNEYLQLVSCYAFERKKYLDKKIEAGEGLVGQCFLERRTIYITDVPHEYVNISSGLGGANPRSILIVPLKVNNEIQGVLELASMHDFKEYQIKFVEKLAESIASQISGVKVNERTRKLLGDSQELTEQLQSQEEEMRQNMEEIQATQEAVEREVKKNKAVLDGCIDAVISINDRGIIDYFNPAAEQLWGLRKEEVMGKNVKVLTPPEIQGQHDSFISNYQKTGEKKVIGSGREVEIVNQNGKRVPVLLTLSEAKVGDNVSFTAFIKDITKQKEQQSEIQSNLEELRSQEEEMRQNMEEMQTTSEELERRQLEMDGTMSAINSTSAFIEFDMEGYTQRANELFLKTMKYELEEIKGKHHRIFVTADHANSTEYAEFWKALKEGKSQSGEFKRIAKDGSEVWLVANYTAVMDSEGKPERVIKLASNITERKTKALEINSKMNALNESNAVIEFLPDGTIDDANENFLNVVGYSLDEVKGKHHRIFCMPEDVNSLEYHEFWKELAEGKASQGEVKRINKNGETVWLQASYTPTKDLNGNVTKVVKFATDITEKKKLEHETQQSAEELKAQEEELRQNMEELQATQEAIEAESRKNRAILDGCVDCVVTINERGIIEYFNPAAEKLWGKKAIDVIGHNVKILTPPEIQGQHDSFLGNYMRTGEKKVIGKGREVEMINAEGKRIPILLTLSEARSGDARTFTAFIKDITEQKEQQEELQKTFEEVRAQEEELRQNMEELQATQEAIEAESKKHKAILDGCVDSVITINDRGIIEYFNPAAEKMWGKKSEEVIGENVKILTPPEIRDRHDGFLSSYKQTGEKKVIGSGREVEIINAEGNRMPVLLTLSEAKSGDKTTFTAFIKDISLQREQKEELQKNLEELRAQEEEMRQNMEEMEATQEEMVRKDMEMSGQMAAIDHTLAMIEFDMEGHIKNANGTFLETMGYDLDEIKGLHHKLFVVAEEAAKPDYIKFWDNLKAGLHHQGEFKRVAKGGREIWLHATYTPVRDKDGKAIKVIKLAQDITEQKKKSLDAQSQIGVIKENYCWLELNKEGDITNTNINLVDLLGYDDIKDLQGRHHRVLVEKNYRKSDEYKEFWSSLTSGESKNGYFDQITKEGESVKVQGSYAPVLNLEGEIEKIVAYLMPVKTEIAGNEKDVKNLEEQLAKSNRVIAELEEMHKNDLHSMPFVNGSSDGKMIVVTNAERKVEWVNKHFEEKTGYKLAELKGKSPSEFLHGPKTEESVITEIRDNLNIGKSFSGSITNYTKDGKLFNCKMTINPIVAPDGSLQKYIAVEELVEQQTDGSSKSRKTQNS